MNCIKCDKVVLKYIDNKSSFILTLENGENKIINVDESINRIKSRMQDVKNGKRELVYLSYCMQNIDLYIEDNYYLLFDEINYYKFDKLEII